MCHFADKFFLEYILLYIFWATFLKRYTKYDTEFKGDTYVKASWKYIQRNIPFKSFSAFLTFLRLFCE